MKRAGEMAAFGLRMNAGGRLRHLNGLRDLTCAMNGGRPWKCWWNGAGRAGIGRFSVNAAGLRFADVAGAEFLR